MKKYILPLVGVILMFSSCEKKKEIQNEFSIENPTNKAELDKISEQFKAIGTMDFDKLMLDEEVKADMLVWKAEYEKIKVSTEEATKGKAGFLYEAPDNKDKKRYVNAKAIEVDQLIKKGLIGAFQLRGFNNSLRDAVMAKEAKARVESLNKGVVYLLGSLKLNKTADEFKAENNSFGKYLLKVAKTAKHKDIDKKLYAAIERAYANANSKEVFNKTLLEINEYADVVVAMRAVHYISGYTGKLREENGFTGGTVHELCEGLGFVYSLQYAYNSKTHSMHFSHKDVKEVTDVNLWEEAMNKTGNSTLDKMSEKIASIFGFTVADAV